MLVRCAGRLRLAAYAVAVLAALIGAAPFAVAAPGDWTLSKTASPTTYSAVGQIIHYTYVITNVRGQDGNFDPGPPTNGFFTDTKVTTVNCPGTSVLAGGLTCTGDYTITAADIAAGSVTNTATVHGDSCGDGCFVTATATATVNFVGQPGWTLTKSANPTTYSLPGQVITYTYVLKNTGPIAITAISLTDNKVTTVNCPANTLAPGAQMTCTGLYTITAADVTATTVTNTATATGTPAAGTLAPVTAQATITLDALQHRQQTLALINQFLSYRLQLLTQDDPDRIQYLRRVPGALWGDGDATGGSTYNTPFHFAGTSDDTSTRGSFSTSLNRIASAHEAIEAVEKADKPAEAMAYAAGVMPLKAPPKPIVKPETGFDVWVEGHFSSFKAQASDTSSSGSYGIIYLGADYMVTRSLMVGFLVQHDWMSDRSQQFLLPTSTIEGQGTMAGPYVSGRLSPHLFFDARMAWGVSDNRINPFGTYQDSFATDRWLARGNLVGNWVFGNVRVTPSAGVTYASERQLAYTDSLGVAIPSQTVSLGRLSVGPEFAYRWFGAGGVLYEPQVSLKGVWDFQRPDVPTVSGLVVSPDALHARAELALLAKAANGFSVRGAVAYDGIGTSNFHDVSGRIWVSVPLH